MDDETPEQKLASLLAWLTELAATKLLRDVPTGYWWSDDEYRYFERYTEDHDSKVFDNGHTVGQVELARLVLDSLRDIGFTVSS